MLAHAFLAVVRADEHAHRPTPGDLIPLTCNEIQHLLIRVVVRPVHGPGPPAELVRLVTHPPGAITSQPLPEARVTEHFRWPP